MTRIRSAARAVGLALVLVTLDAAPARSGETPDPIAPRLGGADPAQGATIALQCKGCHTMEQGAGAAIGPNLWAIVGRPVASQDGFDYSDSLSAVEGEWDYERLNRYLWDPQAMAPGTRMIFPGVKSVQQRAHLIAYLRTLDADPAPLPAVANGVSAIAAGEVQEMDWQGLPAGPGREAVFYSCNTCHSLMLVTQQGMSRERWDETLEWMVEEQGMSKIEDTETRDLILDYLATHYGP